MTNRTITTCLSASALLFAAAGLTALAQPGHDHPHPAPPAQPVEREARKAINERCPVGKNPIDNRTFLQHNGHTIGFCCPGCTGPFRAWSDDRKNTYIEQTLNPPEPEEPAAAEDSTEQQLAALYPLDTCIVSGEKLGSMGEPVTIEHNGRNITFCCDGCKPRFEADPETFTQRLDKALIEQQLPHYAQDTCPITRAQLGTMGEPDNYLYRNRLVRFCCPPCRGGFEADPTRHLQAMDKAAADAQRADYPLDNCIVADMPLGSMGEPHEIVVAGRLIRFCCAGCEPSFRDNPGQHLATLEAAWKGAAEKNAGDR